MSNLYSFRLFSAKLTRIPFESTGTTGLWRSNFSPFTVGLIRQNTRIFPAIVNKLKEWYLAPNWLSLLNVARTRDVSKRFKRIETGHFSTSQMGLTRKQFFIHFKNYAVCWFRPQKQYGHNSNLNMWTQHSEKLYGLKIYFSNPFPF